MAGRKKKAPGKVVKFTGRHVLDDLVGAEKRKEMQIKEPLIIDLLTSLSATYNKPPKKKRFGGGNKIKKNKPIVKAISDEEDRRRTYAELEKRGQRTPGKYFGKSKPPMRKKIKKPKVKEIQLKLLKTGGVVMKNRGGTFKCTY